MTVKYARARWGARLPASAGASSALEFDLTGRVCAFSIGSLPYSGIGGQVNWMALRAR